MQPNPALRRLGFSDTDRVAIIHTDDIGMCQASVQAFADLNEFGLISSGAVMVPCPWFLEAAKFAREHPQADLGVHLTLTCEYKTYRWGPISTSDPASGLIDEEGYLPHRTNQVIERGDPAAVQTEIEAQITRARSAGMAPTHADTHMGALGSPKFMLGYAKMAIANRLPFMFFRMDEEEFVKHGLTPEAAAYAARMLAMLEGVGVPFMDYLVGMPLEEPDHQLEIAKKLFNSLPAGITHFILHPSVDTPELRAIAPDWRSRVGNYQTFLSEELRDYIKQIGVQVIGYRALQELMPDPAVLAGVG